MSSIPCFLLISVSLFKVQKVEDEDMWAGPLIMGAEYLYNFVCLCFVIISDLVG